MAIKSRYQKYQGGTNSADVWQKANIGLDKFTDKQRLALNKGNGIVTLGGMQYKFDGDTLKEAKKSTAPVVATPTKVADKPKTQQVTQEVNPYQEQYKPKASVSLGGLFDSTQSKQNVDNSAVVSKPNISTKSKVNQSINSGNKNIMSRYSENNANEPAGNYMPEKYDALPSSEELNFLIQQEMKEFGKLTPKTEKFVQERIKLEKNKSDADNYDLASVALPTAAKYAVSAAKAATKAGSKFVPGLNIAVAAADFGLSEKADYERWKAELQENGYNPDQFNYFDYVKQNPMNTAINAGTSLVPFGGEILKGSKKATEIIKKIPFKEGFDGAGRYIGGLLNVGGTGGKVLDVATDLVIPGSLVYDKVFAKTELEKLYETIQHKDGTPLTEEEKAEIQNQLGDRDSYNKADIMRALVGIKYLRQLSKTPSKAEPILTTKPKRKIKSTVSKSKPKPKPKPFEGSYGGKNTVDDEMFISYPGKKTVNILPSGKSQNVTPKQVVGFKRGGSIKTYQTPPSSGITIDDDAKREHNEIVDYLDTVPGASKWKKDGKWFAGTEDFDAWVRSNLDTYYKGKNIPNKYTPEYTIAMQEALGDLYTGVQGGVKEQGGTSDASTNPLIGLRTLQKFNFPVTPIQPKGATQVPGLRVPSPSLPYKEGALAKKLPYADVAKAGNKYGVKPDLKPLLVGLLGSKAPAIRAPFYSEVPHRGGIPALKEMPEKYYNKLKGEKIRPTTTDSGKNLITRTAFDQGRLGAIQDLGLKEIDYVNKQDENRFNIHKSIQDAIWQNRQNISNTNVGLANQKAQLHAQAAQSAKTLENQYINQYFENDFKRKEEADKLNNQSEAVAIQKQINDIQNEMWQLNQSGKTDSYSKQRMEHLMREKNRIQQIYNDLSLKHNNQSIVSRYNLSEGSVPVKKKGGTLSFNERAYLQSMANETKRYNQKLRNINNLEVQHMRNIGNMGMGGFGGRRGRIRSRFI